MRISGPRHKHVSWLFGSLVLLLAYCLSLPANASDEPNLNDYWSSEDFKATTDITQSWGPPITLHMQTPSGRELRGELKGVNLTLERDFHGSEMNGAPADVQAEIDKRGLKVTFTGVVVGKRENRIEGKEVKPSDIKWDDAHQITSIATHTTNVVLVRNLLQVSFAPMSADSKTSRHVPAESAYVPVEGGVEYTRHELRGEFPRTHLALSYDDPAFLQKIMAAVFKHAGIKPCESNPKDLQKAPGALDYIEISEVVKAPGERETLGYFIKFEYRPHFRGSDEYLALFSYDKIEPKGKPIVCATELFIFGPFVTKDNVVVSNPPRLLVGLALSPEGLPLKEVPLDLASVGEFLQGPEHKNEPVRPGVDKEGSGCRECHGGVGNHPIDKSPQFTLPFPWTKAP